MCALFVSLKLLYFASVHAVTQWLGWLDGRVDIGHTNNYVHPRNNRTEMYAGRVACCPLVSHVKLKSKMGHTAERTDDAFALTARCCQHFNPFLLRSMRNNQRVLKRYPVDGLFYRTEP